jgi:hypothetical protein
MMGLNAFRMMSDVCARLAVRKWGGEQPTNGRQDKSREVRPGRMGGGQPTHQRFVTMCAITRQPAYQPKASKINDSGTSYRDAS